MVSGPYCAVHIVPWKASPAPWVVTSSGWLPATLITWLSMTWVPAAFSFMKVMVLSKLTVMSAPVHSPLKAPAKVHSARPFVEFAKVLSSFSFARVSNADSIECPFSVTSTGPPSAPRHV